MQKAALIIGVDWYEDQLTTPFEHAGADARALAACLTEHCGFDEVLLLAGREEEAPPGLSRAQDALEELKAGLGADDLFLFGFFGHCVERDGEGYLLLHDSRQAHPAGNSLALKSLRQYFESLECKQRVLLLDAFRNAPQTWRRDADNRLPVAVAASLAGLIRPAPGDRRARDALLNSVRSGGRSYALPEKGRGVFASYLIDVLESISSAGRDIELKEVAEVVISEIRRWSLTNPRTGSPQIPWYEEAGAVGPIFLKTVQSRRSEEREGGALDARPGLPESPDAGSPSLQITLPPVPCDLQDVQRRLEEITSEIRSVENCEAPALRGLAEKVRLLEDRRADLERRLAAAESGTLVIDRQEKIRLAEILSINPDISLSELCELVPQSPVPTLLPYLETLRARVVIETELEDAQKKLEGAQRRKLQALETEATVWRRKRADLETGDLQAVLKAFFATTGAAESFPVDQWVRFQGQMEKRFPDRSARRLLAEAERSFARSLYERALAQETQDSLDLGLIERAAELGCMEAQCDLGDRFAFGRGMERDTAAAVDWYRRAVDAGYPPALYRLGLCYENAAGVERDMEKAAGFYRAAAEENYAAAQFRLGWCYWQGNGVIRSPQEGIRWFRRAAEAGHADAQFSLALFYDRGEHVRQDHFLAMSWREKAAENGHTEAQYTLALACLSGKHVERSPERGVSWLIEAARQGHGEAQIQLARCYETGTGTRADPGKAILWYEKAAAQDYPEAQFALGSRYYQRREGPEDAQKAFEWFRRAAELGHIRAQYNLGVCYQNGEGVHLNLRAATMWFRKAAEQGHAKAQFRLACCYGQGTGVIKDVKQAIRFFRMAAEAGDREAQFRLAIHYLSGDGIDRNPAEAVRWFRAAAEQGHVVAQFNLASCCYNGQGIEKNRLEAREWFERAAENGHATARKVLQQIGGRDPNVSRDRNDES